MKLDRDPLERELQKWNAEGLIFPEYRFVTEREKLHLLGKGGFSYVYEMEHKERPNCLFALKVMEAEPGQSDTLLRNLRTQQYLSRICPYVMPIIDVAEENGLVCVLMEWVSGILQKDENGRLQLCRKELHLRKGILTFALEIGQALQISHQNGILHGDIKPENSYWNREKKCYQLGDFGNHGGYTGGYAAPELICLGKQGYVTVASDIYSYGMMLYVLLNGLRFPGAEGYYCSGQQYEASYVFPAPAGSTEMLTRSIRKMCSRQPWERYHNMEEVLADLRRIQREEKE